jgi:hypothetical protein
VFCTRAVFATHTRDVVNKPATASRLKVLSVLYANASTAAVDDRAKSKVYVNKLYEGLGLLKDVLAAPTLGTELLQGPARSIRTSQLQRLA